jgi:hypothetical protein
VPLGDQCQLRGELFSGYVVFSQNFEEAQDCFAARI